MQYDVDVGFLGKDTVETEAYARRFAEANNAVYISPYNDVKMIAGKNVVLLITGCRIDLKTLKKFLEV